MGTGNFGRDNLGSAYLITGHLAGSLTWGRSVSYVLL